MVYLYIIKFKNKILFVSLPNLIALKRKTDKNQNSEHAAKNEVLFNKLFVDDSGYRLVSSSPKVFSAIHKEDFSENFYLSDAEMDSYIRGFIDTVNDNIEEALKIVSKNSSENDFNESAIDDSDVKLGLYRSFKSLYDKWVCKSRENQTSGYFYNNYGESDDRMLFEHFSFVTRGNVDIGAKAVIDVNFLSNLSSRQSGQGPTQSLYQSLTDLLSKNNFDFFALPNIIEYSSKDKTVLEDIFRAFDGPIIPEPAKPGFVCLFVGGNSRTLDIPSSYCDENGIQFQYQSDSFDIENPATWPQDIADNNGITAFLVKYGQQTQNHFSSIELDQSEFKETQESLMVIDALVNPKSGSQPSQAGKGNNIFDSYLTRNYSCTVGMLGDIMIQPLMYFKLDNIPMYRGTYIIKNVTHTITPNNVKTSFVGVRQPLTTVPIVVDAISLLDLSLVDVESANNESTSTTSLTSNESSGNIESVSGGPGLDPIIFLVVGKESGGDYEIYNYGSSGGAGIRSSTQGSSYYSANAIKLTDKTVNQIIALQAEGKMFAVGKYQTIPVTLKSGSEKLGLGNALFNSDTQEKIGSYLFVGSKRTRLAAYLKATNDGTKENLENAVQDLGLEFASMPIITKDGVTWGDVTKGTGNKAYYGGKGPNPDNVKITVGTVVNALIKSRIQYSGKKPSFIPNYYKS